MRPSGMYHGIIPDAKWFANYFASGIVRTIIDIMLDTLAIILFYFQ